jgi:hypothetical protein
VLSCVVDHILQEFNTLFLTRFRTTPNKTSVKTTFGDWCLYSSFVHGIRAAFIAFMNLNFLKVCRDIAYHFHVS